MRLALLLLTLVPPLAAKDLQAGAAKVALDLPTGLIMAGYGARTGTSTGTLDPLHAKVLVIEGAETAVALVTLDLSGCPPAAQLDRIRERVKASTGIADVIFNASHTHSGPFLMDDPPPWQQKLERDIGDAIERAWKARRPARIGVGRGAVQIGHNRLYPMQDGNGRMLWRNETRLPTAPVDPSVYVLRIDAADGSPLAILVNYACHPVVLGPDNVQYSADYPGEMMRAVEQAYPAALCLFLQGGAGNINPYHDKTPLIEDAVAVMRQTGRTLAREVLRVLLAIATAPLPDAPVRIARQTLTIPGRWNRSKLLAGVDLEKMAFDPKMRLLRATAPSYQAPVTMLLVGRAFAFAGVPAEIFVDYQIDIRNRVSEVPVLFAGYTNAVLGYVPTMRGAVDGGYGANQLGAYLEVGAGNRFIDTAVVQLALWLGKLQSAPQTPR